MNDENNIFPSAREVAAVLFRIVAGCMAVGFIMYELLLRFL